MDVHVTTTGGTGVTKPGSFFDLVLTSTTYTGGTALPTATVAGPSTTDISSFLTTKATLVWDPSAADGTAQDFTADITNFNGVDVPEPSSLVLAIVGMATCTGGFLISRRKAAGALQSGRIAS